MCSEGLNGGDKRRRTRADIQENGPPMPRCSADLTENISLRDPSGPKWWAFQSVGVPKGWLQSKRQEVCTNGIKNKKGIEKQGGPWKREATARLGKKMAWSSELNIECLAVVRYGRLELRRNVMIASLQTGSLCVRSEDTLLRTGQPAQG